MYGNQRDKLFLCSDYYFLNNFQLAKLLGFLLSSNTLFSFQIILIHSATSTLVCVIYQLLKEHSPFRQHKTKDKHHLQVFSHSLFFLDLFICFCLIQLLALFSVHGYLNVIIIYYNGRSMFFLVRIYG